MLKRHKAVWKDLAAPARDLGFRPLPSPDGGEGPRVRRSSPTATWRWVALPWRRAPSCTSTDTRRGIQAHGGPARGGGSADDGMGGISQRHASNTQMVVVDDGVANHLEGIFLVRTSQGRKNEHRDNDVGNQNDAR